MASVMCAVSTRAELRLSNPESEVYYRFAVAAGDQVQVDQQGVVSGDLYSNDRIVLRAGSSVNGNVSAVDEVDVNGSVTGTITEGAVPLTLPVLLQEDALRALANRVFEGDTTFVDEVINDIVFVDGSVRIRGSLGGVGTVIAIGEIRLDGTDDDSDSDSGDSDSGDSDSDSDSGDSDSDSGDSDSDSDRGDSDSGDSDSDDSDSDSDRGDSDSGDSDSDDAENGDAAGGFDLDLDSRLSLIASRDIRVGKERPFRGILRSGRDVKLEMDARLEGVAIADRKVRLKKGAVVTFFDFDEASPVILLATPLDGSLVPSAQPEIRVDFEDDLSGVRPQSVVFLLDGIDRASEASILPAGIVFAPSTALMEGPHVLEVMASDHSGKSAAASFTFTIDSIPPLLSIVAPLEPVVYNDPIPPVAVAYSDVGTGLDAASLRITVDGGELTASCSITDDGATCQSSPLVDGTHTLASEISDRAGNQVTVTRTFEVATDRELPTIVLDEPADGALLKTAQLQVSGSAIDDIGVISITVNGIPAQREGDAWSAGVTLEEGRNDLRIVATDVIGGQGVLRARVTLDTRPPDVSIESPMPGASTNTATLEVSGLVSDLNGIERVEIDGAMAALDGDRFALTVPLENGANAFEIRAVDGVGNSREVVVEVDRIQLPIVAFTSPANLSLVTSPEIDVLGTVNDSGATVTVNGAPAAVVGNTFSVSSLPLVEGSNFLSAIATAPDGRQSTARLAVYRDATPPTLSVEGPAEGTTFRQSAVAVRGWVSDPALSGVNAPPPTVIVNGISARVDGNFYLAEDVPLIPGENPLTAIAVDNQGNTSEVRSTVFFEPPTRRFIRVDSGSRQAAPIDTQLAQPLVARLTDVAGNPIAGRPVIFKITGNNGGLNRIGLAESWRQIAVLSDVEGRAAVEFTLGTRAGAGSQRVEATSAGFQGVARFYADAQRGEPEKVLVDGGGQQVGIAGQALAEPFHAVVTDAGFNRLPDVAVTFRVVDGEGFFQSNGQLQRTVMTDREGRATALLVLDPSEGIANNVVEASLDIAPDGPRANFVASGKIAGDPIATTVAGQVLDNTNQPIAGATLRIEGTNLVAQSDDQGLFQIVGAPVGTHRLVVDGSTVSRSGSWPDLVFLMNLIPGVENTLPGPIYLLPLDLANGVAVSESEGGVVTLPDLPGFALEIAPGSATFPDGSRQGTVSVTPVHTDKVPMVPGFGQQPRFIVTIQPAGTIFDPPARLSLPNVDGLEPGESTEFYSFDHDLEAFVGIGLGTASEDGLTVVSNPGVGVRKAGWHCGDNPSQSGTPHDCPECLTCSGSRCVADAGQDGNECEDDFCKECREGACVATSTEVEIQSPPDNPNPADADFATNFSFLSDATITAMASLTDRGDSSEIEWSVTAAVGGVTGESPADRKGPTFSFMPDPPAPAAYTRGTGCGNPGNGSCGRSQALSYDLLAEYCESEDEHTVTQDQIDIVRQEYLNHGINVPIRGDFTVPVATANFTVAEIIGPNAYSIVLGTPGQLAQDVRDEFNARIRDDVQAVPVGTPMLPANAPVVTPGANVQTLGPLLDTEPCNNAPNPGACDDQVMGNVIVAGANGIAETQAENRVTGVPLRLNSGWRNPERNEAVGGVLNSCHQFGDAVDLDIFGPAEGKTMAQLFCILQTAGDAVADGFAEQFGTQRQCNDARVTHVHVQR